MALVTFSMSLSAQEQVQGFVHQQSKATDYVWPTDQQVLDKLAKWQDQKFGVLFHWGLYSVPGIVESWSICSEDVDWISRKGNLPYDEYKKWYWGLKDSLNPVNFNPEQWAEVMQDAGIKYMIFTTKHHDGFCTFDSKYTDFSIANGPFKNNPRKDVAFHVFDVFRKKGFMMGCYFPSQTGIVNGSGILILLLPTVVLTTKKRTIRIGGRIIRPSHKTNWMS